MQGFYDEVLTLRTITPKYVDGFLVNEVTNENVVFAEKKSVARSEFYLSAQAGIKADVAFALNAADFDGQTEVEHGGEVFTVARTYQKNKDTIELVCTRRD